jgi:enediyne biosynthesis protein E4
MTSAVSYASSSLDPVHFGLGSVDRIDRLQILWPDHKEQVLRDVRVDQVLQVREPN